MSAAPRVSVVISTYNRAGLLPRAARSVLSQSFGDIELIIVDDCSTDDTRVVIDGLAEADSRVRVVRHLANRGQPAALNSGIMASLGEYIAFLDDDDEYMPGKLSGQIYILDRSPPEVGADRDKLVRYGYCAAARLTPHASINTLDMTD